MQPLDVYIYIYDNVVLLPGQDHINIIIILSVQVICQNITYITVPNITTETYTKYNNLYNNVVLAMTLPI